MKEHPILFSTPMVQAILEGRKTQTRRIVKKDIPQNVTTIDRYNKTGQFTLWENRRIVSQIGESPYGKPGDLLWVRETWTKDKKFPLSIEEPNTSIFTYFFKADKKEHVSKLIKWKPSIHMPKAAARIWLEIEEVKVERLQDISEEDAQAEGLRSQFSPLFQEERYEDYLDLESEYRSAVSSFKSLWYKINGIESWHENPWVWVVKFKVVSTTGKPSFDSAQDDKNIHAFTH